MIVLTVMTLGFYYPIWFLRRRRGLNSLDSPRKLAAWPFVLLLALYVVEFALGFISAPGRPEDLVGTQAVVFLNLSELAVGVLVIVQCFFIKDILEDHLSGPGETLPSPLAVGDVKLSGLLTFLFTIFYLQHVINREVLDRQVTTA